MADRFEHSVVCEIVEREVREVLDVTRLPLAQVREARVEFAEKSRALGSERVAARGDRLLRIDRRVVQREKLREVGVVGGDLLHERQQLWIACARTQKTLHRDDMAHTDLLQKNEWNR